MKTIQEILENRRRENEINLEKRKKEVFEKESRIIEIIDLVKKKNILRIKMSFKNLDVTLLTEEINELIKTKNDLLIENGFSLDYLELKYTCEKCKDTGVNGTKICDCRKQLKIRQLYQQSEIEKAVAEENFNNFNLNLFRKDRQNEENISPYENIKEIKNELYEYAVNFGRDSVSLYLYGAVGTGKTYMLNSIAKEVLDLGYSVIYLSESQLVDEILEYRFAYANTKSELRPKYNMILDCDLLIIDDLGANTKNANANSAIFEVLNKRLVKKLPVIISSNLSPEELRINYDMRLFSRIVGTYIQRKFYGNDIRMR